jgi:hypothetical protein
LIARVSSNPRWGNVCFIVRCLSTCVDISALATCVAVSMHGRENQRGRDKKWVAVATSIIRLHGSEEKKRRDAMIYAVELMCS